MKKVLITGGAGYIGSHLTSHLLQHGFAVTVVDLLLYKQTSLLGCCAHPGFRFYKGDVCDQQLMNPLIAWADIVIPLAAIVGAPACAQNPALTQLVNYDSVEHLLRRLEPHQQVFFPNTNSGYGIGTPGILCTEESPLRPVSLYGRLKVAIEKQLLLSQQAVCFRLATVFGLSPRMRLDLLVNDFTHRACRDRAIVLFEEHAKRNFIHVLDVVRAFHFAIEHFEEMRGQTYNVGLSSANLSKRELCERIRLYVPEFYIHSADIGHDPDQRDYIVSNAKLENLGWAPRYTLDDGIQELIKAYGMLHQPAFANL